jgi:hypothetical protein
VTSTTIDGVWAKILQQRQQRHQQGKSGSEDSGNNSNIDGAVLRKGNDAVSKKKSKHVNWAAEAAADEGGNRAMSQQQQQLERLQSAKVSLDNHPALAGLLRRQQQQQQTTPPLRYGGYPIRGSSSRRPSLLQNPQQQQQKRHFDAHETGRPEQGRNKYGKHL